MIRRPPRSTLFPTRRSSDLIPKQDASHLYQPQVVGSLLLVAHQNRPAFRQPAQRPLHYPASRRIALLSGIIRSEEHTSELQSRQYLVCRLLLEKKNTSNLST